MKRISAAMLSLVLVLGTVGSVAAQDDAENIKIGMANLSLCCPYFIGMSEAVEQEASAYDNVEVLVTNADGDVEKLTSDIEDLIAKKRRRHRPLRRLHRGGARRPWQPSRKPASRSSWSTACSRAATTRAGSARTTTPSACRTASSSSSSWAAHGKLGVIRGGPADNTIGSDRTDGMLSQVEADRHRGHHLSRTSPAGARTAASRRPRPCWPRTPTSTPSSARTTPCAWGPRRSSRTRGWPTRSSWSAWTARRPPSSRS